MSGTLLRRYAPRKDGWGMVLVGDGANILKFASPVHMSSRQVGFVCVEDGVFLVAVLPGCFDAFTDDSRLTPLP